jgi:hypothetical protein
MGVEMSKEEEEQLRASSVNENSKTEVPLKNEQNEFGSNMSLRNLKSRVSVREPEKTKFGSNVSLQNFKSKVSVREEEQIKDAGSTISIRDKILEARSTIDLKNPSRLGSGSARTGSMRSKLSESFRVPEEPVVEEVKKPVNVFEVDNDRIEGIDKYLECNVDFFQLFLFKINFLINKI